MALQRRAIEDSDLDKVAQLLASGFPRRAIREWRRGLALLKTRTITEDAYRYGLCLENEGRLVGVILMIFGEVYEAGGTTHLRCNLSSWYVEPAYALYAPALLSAALSKPDVTYFNVTPAAHTEAIITAQGFKPFCRGSLVCLPAVTMRGTLKRVRRLTSDHLHRFVEGDMLRRHLELGCLCFFVEEQTGPVPFVFAAPRRLRSIVPGAHLLYCRDLDGFARNAGALGRALLRRGVLVVLVDSNERPNGLVARSINQKQGRFFKGPHTLRPGDLAFAEFAIFGG